MPTDFLSEEQRRHFGHFTEDHGRYSFALPNEVQGGQLRSTAKPEKAASTTI